MNSILSFALAVLVYPGILVSVLVAVLLLWIRASVANRSRAGATLSTPLRVLAELRAARAEETASATPTPLIAPLAAAVAIICPLVALVLLPVPGNPLASALGLSGDITAEGALLFGAPLARLFAGWVSPSGEARRAADAAARVLAGAALPVVLALTVSAEESSSLALQAGTAPASAPLLDVIARILAAAAFACALTALVRNGASQESAQLAETEQQSALTKIGFPVSEGVQLVAVIALFLAAFVLPLFSGAQADVRAAIWVIGLVASAAALGIWEGQRRARKPGTDRPPLSWWAGLPTLLALAALVAAAWATRGI